MAVTSLPSTTSLLDKLQQLHPNLAFAPDELFRWSPGEQVVYYDPSALATPEGCAQLLHEAGHALLRHREYTFDVELVHLEAAAWQRAKILAATLDWPLNNDDVQDALDSYRVWLASRSECPKCQQTGIQKGVRAYVCLVCHASWHVNDAKFCATRRYTLGKQK